MKHASTRALFEYWNEKRGNRPAPEREDIDPIAIRHALGDTFMLAADFVNEQRFRLAGTLTTGPGEADPVDAEVEEAVRGYVRRLQHGAGSAGQEQMVWQELTLRLSPQRYERMLARLRALLLEFDSDSRDDRPGLHTYRLLVVAYPEDPPAAPPGPPIVPD